MKPHKPEGGQEPSSSARPWHPDPSICENFIPLPDPSKLTYEEIVSIFGRERVERFQREIFRMGLAALAEQRAAQAANEGGEADE